MVAGSRIIDTAIRKRVVPRLPEEDWHERVLAPGRHCSPRRGPADRPPDAEAAAQVGRGGRRDGRASGHGLHRPRRDAPARRGGRRARRRPEHGPQRGGAVVRPHRAGRQRLDLLDPADLRPTDAAQPRLELHRPRSRPELDDLARPQDVYVPPAQQRALLERCTGDGRRRDLLARPHVQPEALLLLVPVRGGEERPQAEQQHGSDQADGSPTRRCSRASPSSQRRSCRRRS